uniref:Uncharacterized protein n=1 Tax=uncultured microorganism TaxID=358574 RepID=I2FJJ1_9ZZZZ|nr:hypothetical protein [uncultured microorganism]
MLKSGARLFASLELVFSAHHFLLTVLRPIITGKIYFSCRNNIRKRVTMRPMKKMPLAALTGSKLLKSLINRSSGWAISEP